MMICTKRRKFRGGQVAFLNKPCLIVKDSSMDYVYADSTRPTLHKDCIHKYLNIIILTAMHAGLIEVFFCTTLYDASQIRCQCDTWLQALLEQSWMRRGHHAGTSTQRALLPPGMAERGAMVGQGR